MESESGRKRVTLARLGPLPWIGAGFCWLMAVLMPVIAQFRVDRDGREMDWVKAILALLLWLILGMLLALFAGLSQITVTTEGLRWRKWLPWKPFLTWQTASWAEIADFYDTTNLIGLYSAVETHDGRRLTFSIAWQGFILLREAIVEYAIRAEPAYDQSGRLSWMPKGTRPSELPITFAYSEAQIHKYWYGGLVISIGLVGLFAIPTVLFLPSVTQPSRADGTIFPILLFGIIELFIMGLLGWVLYQEWHNCRQAHRQRRNGEEFVAARDGLTVWQAGESRKISWGEIIGYEFSLSGQGLRNSGATRFRTRTGEEYSFTPLINNYTLLSRILPQFATDAVAFRRDQNEKEALGGVGARWSGGEEGKGDRVFHRRTRTNQAFIGFVSFFFLLFAWYSIRLLLMPYGYFALSFFVPVVAFFGFILYGGLTEYFRERVLVGVNGITYINKHGRERRLRWENIERIWTEGNIVSLTGTDGGRMNFLTTGYAYGNELPTLLTERLALHRRSVER